MENIKIFFSIGLIIVSISLWNLRDNADTIFKGNRKFSNGLVLSYETISPGNSPGIIKVTGNFKMESEATYICELKDMTGAGIGHDQIDVSGDITLAGALDVVLDGYVVNNTDYFDIIEYDGEINGTFGSVSGLPPGWKVDYGVRTEHTVTLYGPESTLPIELISFNGKRIEEMVRLTWETTSEINSDYFELLYSRDAINFSTIEKIKSKGMNTGINTYTYYHKNPDKNICYYRLRQVDKDGESTLSPIVFIDMGDEEINFYPNPTSGIINFNKPVESVTIYNTMGKVIFKKESIKTNLDISNIKEGIYMIDINDGVYIQKLVIE